MPTAKQDADIVLSHTDGTSNVVPLKLFRDSSRLPGGYRQSIRPYLPSPAPTDGVDVKSVDPLSERLWEMRDWSNGALQPLERQQGQSNRYGYSDGVLATERGELTLGYQQDEVDAILRNGRFETGDATGWTASHITAVASTTIARTGNYCLRCSVLQAGGTVSQTYGGDVSVLQGRTIKFVGYAGRFSGSGTVKLRITDDVSGDTDSATVSSVQYGIMEVSATINAAATSVTFTLVFSDFNDIWFIDDLAIIPEGESTFHGSSVIFQDNCYVPCGRMILKWSEADDAFYPVYFDDSEQITSLCSFSTDGTPRLYAARGDNDNYLVSSNGTSWSDPSTNSGDNALATHFAVARNTNGDLALFKTRGSTVAISTDPTDTANWGSEIQVGDDNYDITSLFAARDLIIVGKEDGPYVYDSANDLFEVLQPEGGSFPDPSSFKVATARGSYIFANGTDQTFWRIPIDPGEEWQDLSDLISTSAFRGLGGKVSAIAQDPGNMWVALPDNLEVTGEGFPYTFPFFFDRIGISTKVMIATIQQLADESGNITRRAVHTVCRLSFSTVDQMGRFVDSTDQRSSLFVFGTVLNSDIGTGDDEEPRIVRLALPIQNTNPALVGTRRIRLKGSFYTSWNDDNFPGAIKTSTQLEFGTRNLSGTDKFLTVYYKKDDDTDDDEVGWTLYAASGATTVNTSPFQTVTPSLTSPVEYKRIRFRIDFETDSVSDEPPRLFSMVHHSVLSSDLDFLEWDIDSLLSDNRQSAYTARGARVNDDLATVLSDLNTLRQQSFVKLQDIDGTVYRVKVRERTLSPVDTRNNRSEGSDPLRQWALSLKLTEVKTS